MSAEKDEDLEDFFDEPGLGEDIAEELTDGPGEDVFNEDSETVEEVMSNKSEVAVAQKAELGELSTPFDFTSLGALPGVIVGNTGIEVSRFPVEKTKFSKGQRSMISILSDQVVVAKVHYDEDIGSFLCFGGACCKDDLARVKYVYPVLQYETNAKGKPISKEVKCKAFAIGADTYQSLLDIQELKGPLTQFDLLISCTDEQYQTISIQEAGQAKWKKAPEMVRKIQEFWAENSAHLLKAVARKITPEQYAKARAGVVTEEKEVDFDDVFK